MFLVVSGFFGSPFVFSGISDPNHNLTNATGNEYPGTLCDKERRQHQPPKLLFSLFNEGDDFISCGYISELTIEGGIAFENDLLKKNYSEEIKNSDFRGVLINSFYENLKKYNRENLKISYGGRFPSARQRAIRYKILFFSDGKSDLVAGAVVAVEILPSFVATKKSESSGLTSHTYDYPLSVHIIRAAEIKNIRDQFVRLMVEKLNQAEFSL